MFLNAYVEKFKKWRAVSPNLTHQPFQSEIPIEYSGASYKKARDPGDGGDSEFFKTGAVRIVGTPTSGKE